MDEIREAARAYYDNFSDEQKQRASQFFQLLDADGDGRVSTREFLDFLLKEERIAPDLVPRLFQKLDANGDGVLDFWECMTLYYMTRAGRLVFCNGCGSYLDGIRFVCVPCFGSNVNGRGYNLCASCYRNRKYSHHHSYFLDNYLLLEVKRSEEQHRANQSQEGNTSREAQASDAYKSWTENTSTEDEVYFPRKSRMEKLKEALGKFEKAINIRQYATETTESCTIM